MQLNIEQMQSLRDEFPNIVLLDEPLARHTSFKIGGPADALAIPGSQEDLVALLNYCHRQGLPVVIIGNGTNLLVRDKGIRAVVIKIASAMSTVCLFDQGIEAESGISLAALAQTALEAGLGGLEFAAGIPGSLGGAVVMNAGAYGGEMKDVVERVWAVSYQGEEAEFTAEDMDFGYRRSRLQGQQMIITKVRLRLVSRDSGDIRSQIAELAARRRASQPLNLPSAGSVFKRPPGLYVGPMIQEAGLQGKRIGGAEVSTKHAGFIVNVGGATAADVLALIGLIQETVERKFGVKLEPEVRIIGEE